MGINYSRVCAREKFMKKKTDILVLFGASAFGKKALEYIKSINIKADYFCDNDSEKWGRYIEGVKIIAPSELAELIAASSVKVIISSMYEKDIEKQLKVLGATHVYNLFDIYNDIDSIDEHHNERDHFSRELILSNKEKLDQVVELLEDTTSKEVFGKLIEFRLTKDISIMRDCRDDCAEYLNSSIIQFFSDEVIVDGGSFTGDTLECFVKATDFKKYYAFEPDKRNYLQLVNNIEKLGIGDKVVPVNKGISNINGVAAFFINERERGSNFISSFGNSEIEVVRLDDYIPSNEKVTFIKLDIEGAEKDALDGCRNILGKYKPKLAICIYHKPDDMWEIPLMIKKMVPEYKIYVRHYSNYLWETVCYAV